MKFWAKNKFGNSNLLNATGAILLAVGVVGCGASRQAGWEVAQTKIEGDAAVFKAQADEAWAMRDTKEGLEKALALYEKSWAVDATQITVGSQLARGYYFLADAYFQGDKENQLAIYDKAAQWGERTMAIEPKYVAAAEEKDVIEALQVLGPQYHEAIYWAGAAIGKWANLTGFTTVLSKRKQISTMVEVAGKHKPDYFYGAIPRFLGVVYAKAPSFAGGDMELSKKNFDESVAIEPAYLGTKVLYAEMYAVKAQDCKLFTNLLNEVLTFDVTTREDIRAENLSELRKAKSLLEQKEDLFAECEEAAPAPQQDATTN